MADKNDEKEVFKRPPDVSQLGVIRKRKVKVLDEDEYVEKLEKLIERDFFPEIDKLKARSEYIDAAERNDTKEMQRLRERFSTGRPPTESMSRLNTPSTFGTPEHSNKPEDMPSSSKVPEPQIVEEPKKDELKKFSLDTFLTHHTSEDNESFHEIMEEQREEFERTHSWMFKKEEQLSIENKSAQLALPSIEDQCAESAIENKVSKPLDGWTYKNVNAVFYNPDGAPLSDKEKVELAKKKRSINIDNTRFKTNPWKLNETQKGSLVAAKKEHEMGKVGADGKDLVDPKATPSVNGYKMLRLENPSPMINPEESPFMTWGEVESTPYRIDAEDEDLMLNNAVGAGPSFKIQDVPKRDRIALELAEKNSKFYRDKKNKAIEKARSHMKTPQRGNMTLRVASMSPAAQRLATSKLGIRIGTDKVLQAAYTPSPRTSRSSKSTPTPSIRTKNLISSSVRATPSSTPKIATPSTPKPVLDPTSLTDDLLNLPSSSSKRAKASDYL